MKSADQEQSKFAWFVVRVALFGLICSYALSTEMTIAFFAGWWWGVRDE
jgi:hypothetical protein